jgi:hypothetical protein
VVSGELKQKAQMFFEIPTNTTLFSIKYLVSSNKTLAKADLIPDTCDLILFKNTHKYHPVLSRKHEA